MTAIPAFCHSCPARIDVPVSRQASNEALTRAGWQRTEKVTGRHHRITVLCPECKEGR